MLMHDPPHPGEFIRRQCLEPLGLTVTECAGLSGGNGGARELERNLMRRAAVRWVVDGVVVPRIGGRAPPSVGPKLGWRASESGCGSMEALDPVCLGLRVSQPVQYPSERRSVAEDHVAHGPVVALDRRVQLGLWDQAK